MLPSRGEEWWRTPSPELAYIYGFAFADGIVRRGRGGRTKNDLTLTQACRDDLESIQAVAGGGHLRLATEGHVWLLSFRAKDGIRADVLKAWGLVPNKTEHGWFPDVPSDLLPHYVRGFFDGDGSISLMRRGPRQRLPVLAFVCHLQAYLERLSQVFLEIGASPRRPFQDGRNWRLRYTSRSDLSRIHRWLYTDSTLAIPRKRSTFDAVAEYVAVDHRPRGTEHHMVQLAVRTRLNRPAAFSGQLTLF